MAITLDATIAGVSSNSYVSLATAKTYGETLLEGDVLLSLNDEKIRKYLVNAAENMEHLKYRYGKSDSDQALSFPRDASPDLIEDENETAADEIPVAVAKAQVEEAIALARGYRPAAGGTSQFGSTRITQAGSALASAEAYKRLHMAGWLTLPVSATLSKGIF